MEEKATSIDWHNPEAQAVDGFTIADIEVMVREGVAVARCTSCEAEVQVEPDAREYDCPECGEESSVTSPLVKLGLI